MNNLLNEFLNAFSSLFSTPGIIGFFIGVVFEYLFMRVRCLYLDKNDPKGRPHTVKFKRVYLVWALVFLVIGGLTYKSQATYNAIVKLSHDTQDCSRQFNAALKARADTATEESSINARWQDANFDRTAALNTLVKQFGSYTDPRYLMAKASVDQIYYDRIHEIFEDRTENAQRRASLGYPEPTCGK